ncbi:MAG TPA: PAS domain S-box protein, partial [Allocoleopsis sp.]
TYFNPAGCESLGISSEIISQTKIIDYVAESYHQLINNEVIPQIMNNGQWRGELQLRHFQTNELIDVDIVYFLVKNLHTNQPVGIATVQRDIRERKKRDLYLNTLVEIQRLLLADNGKNDLEKYIFDLIGTTFNISRIILLEKYTNSEGELGRKINYQWCAKDMLPIDDNLFTQSSLNQDVPYILSVLQKGEIFAGIVAEMPEPEKSFFAPLAVQRLLAFPVIIKGKIWGILSIHDCENNSKWSDLEIRFLTTTVNAIAMAKERQLNQTQLQKQLTAIETVTEGICITNASEEYVYANPAYLEQFGYDSLEKLLGKTWRDNYDYNEIQRIENESYISLQHTGKYPSEGLAKKQNGSKFIAEFTVTMINNNGFVSVVRDITERKQAEKALRESEERYRQIVETAQEGIWVIDAHANTTYINPQMAKILGYEEVEMIGKSMYDFMDENARKEALKNMERRIQGISENHDFCFTRKD